VASGGEKPQEFTSPMTLEIEADGLLGSRVWTKSDLKGYVCDNVSIELLQIQQAPLSRGKIKLTYMVQVKTRPSHDKLAAISIRIMNDSEKLPIKIGGSQSYGRSIRIDAEEKKLRSKKERAITTQEDLERVLSGENPRVVVVMTVTDN
jgi:hypothetical protein